MTDGDLRPLDRGQLLREIEMQALRDGQAAWAGVGDDVPPGPVHRQIDQWAQQRLAQIESARTAADDDARARVRAAEAELATAEERRDHAQDVAAEAERRRGQLAAVLRGGQRDTAIGDWSDPARMEERPWRGRLVDAAVYGAAAVAEVSLNYLAFQLMGADRLETAALAAAVVLVAVLLPKQIGALLATARRTGRWAGWPLGLMATATALWLAVSVFTAVVRTAYLLLPAGSGVARPALLAVAGLGRTPLTLGWLAVAMAVGAAVLLRSYHRHNPYARAWHRARAAAEEAAAERSGRRAAAEDAAQRLAQASDERRGVAARFVPLAAECRALAAELKACYTNALRRQAITGEPPNPPAIEPGT